MVSRPVSGTTVGLTDRRHALLLQTFSNSALARGFLYTRLLPTKDGCWVCIASPSCRSSVNSSPCGTGFNKSIYRRRRRIPLLGSGMTPKYTQPPPPTIASSLVPSPPCTLRSSGRPRLSPSAFSSCGYGCEVEFSPTTIWRQGGFRILKNATSATSRMRHLFTLSSNAPLPEPSGSLWLLSWAPHPYLLWPSKHPPSLFGGMISPPA